MPTVLSDPYNVGNEPGRGPLRQGGQSVTSLPTSPSAARDLPSTRSPEAEKQAHAVTLVRDLWGGTETVRSRTTEYLPKAPAEEPENYSTRLLRSVFTNFFRRTVEGLVGFIFRRDPVLNDDVPVVIRGESDEEGVRTKEGHWENIDLAGTHGDVFLRELEVDAVETGHAGILVEYPDTSTAPIARMPNGQPTREADLQFRPYWVPIRKEHILSWRTTLEHGRLVLTQLVLMECEYVADGQYGEKMEERYRVITRSPTGTVGFSVFKITPDKKVIQVGLPGIYKNQTEIPFAEVRTSGSYDFLCSTPPLLDLAYLNIAHYQQASDYATSLHMTCVPMLFTAGVQTTNEKGEPVKIGTHSAIMAADPNAKAMYVSHDGQSLGACKQALDDLKTDMATLGLSMLAPDKRAAETAQAKRIDKGTSDSSLAVMARALQDAAERALGFHAKYLGLPSGGSVTINRDFESMTMTPELMNAWAAFIATGFPKEEVVEALKQSGNLSPDADTAAIVRQWQGEEDAKAELRDMENQTRLAGMMGMNGPPKEPAGMKPTNMAAA